MIGAQVRHVALKPRAVYGIAIAKQVLGRGLPGAPLAAVLGVRPQAVYQAVARGRAARAEWDQRLGNYLVGSKSTWETTSPLKDMPVEGRTGRVPAAR